MELRDYVKEWVAAYKYPRQVWLGEELPKGPAGKILKRQIERLAAQDTPPRTERRCEPCTS